jgi:integrase
MLSHTWCGPKREAGKALAAWVTEQSAEHTVTPTTKTLGWLLDRWFALLEKEDKSPTTLQTYRGYADNWIRPALGSKALSALSAGDLRELHASMSAAGKSDSTIRQTHAIVRGSLAFAVENQWVGGNVATIRRPPKQSAPSVVVPDLSEVGALLAAAGERGSDLWTCIALAATLGARAGELCGLRWSDVDLAAGTVKIERSAYTVKGTVGLKEPKTSKSRRTIAVDALTVAVLRERWDWQLDRNERVGTDLVADPFVLSFWSNGDGPPRPDSYSTAFGRVRDSLGFKHLHLHSLRHFMVSYALDQGIPMAAVSDRAGHSSMTTTAKFYAHSVKGRDQEAAAILGRVLV